MLVVVYMYTLQILFFDFKTGPTINRERSLLCVQSYIFCYGLTGAQNYVVVTRIYVIGGALHVASTGRKRDGDGRDTMSKQECNTKKIVTLNSLV